MNNLVENNNMPTIDNFLKQGVEQIRQSILDIDESYNHDWDLLAELLQNSVDAIRETGRTDGEITINIDCQNRSIEVRDNGKGIEPTALPTLLSLFGTNKRGNENSIGEKGVGLKFAIFSCNEFLIETATQNGAIRAEIADAFNWKNSTEDINLPLNHNDITRDFEGTLVRLKKIPEMPLFTLSFQQLKYVLRTRTAIGNTIPIWDTNDIDISIKLNFINLDGESLFEKLPFRYWLPTDGLDENEKINIDEYSNYIKNGDKDDMQKRIKLKSKIIYRFNTFQHRGRTIKAYSCLVPKWGTWDKLSIAFSLASEIDLEDDKFLEEFSYTTFQSGIFTSVKGMPTGISIEHPLTGAGGTWAQVFMLFEDKKLKFDIGRKSIHGRQKSVYKEYARSLFNDYRPLLRYISGDVDTDTSTWERDDVFNEIDKLIDLRSSITSFSKTPRSQEGTVAAMFFECIGNKTIKGITPLIAGYKNRYDLYALWGRKRIVIEFKAQLFKILKDFKEETKLFSEVNCIVCWDVNEIDEQAFSDVGISLEPVVEKKILQQVNERFPAATHTLRFSGLTNAVHVIDIKKVIGAPNI